MLTAVTLLAAALTGPATTETVQECRTAATAATTKTTGQGFTAETTTACRYDKATNKTTCTNTYQDTFGTKTKMVSVTTYAALADAIDETTVIPPRRRSLHTETTAEGPRGKSSSSLINTYDDQKRLIKEVGMTSEGVVNVTTTYASWDAAGRPTAGKSVTRAGTSTLTLTYNDATRTQQTTTDPGGPRIVCDQTFDANGNPAASACRSGSNQPNESKTTTTATEKICR